MNTIASPKAAPKAAPYTEPTPKAAPPVIPPEVAARLAALEVENAALKSHASAPRHLSRKVSEKGGLSVYGLGRFPVTLYREQWERLLDPKEVAATLKFIADNGSALKTKGE